MIGCNVREKFFTHVRDVCKSGYKVSIDKVLGHLSKSGRVKDDNIRSLFFCDFMQAEHVYDEITDLRELHNKMEQ